MHIILTHEQADFDALASLLGAHLLDESAVPVLPRRMNRNVRAFLTLYGIELPFVDPRDLKAESIELVTLVDTQSMVSIKGMSAQTRVRVIDHHPQRETLPDGWQVTTVETGAITTLLIEALREGSTVFSTIQATLLLLGIYEDTGSLTYARTTARDLRAAAYLIEQGASLQIANDFLNHPLSPRQQELYDYLRKSAETLHIHGHTIVAAWGEALDMEEELSSIAHKLRDLLDPDALILLITTRSGVQLIARSTSENIDVAEIAIAFGGGGHERAAAALIKDRQLASVRDELIERLPHFVHPAITVAQIMSRDPHVLEAGTPVETAAQHMRRYGYEGYPVLRNGKLAGLLTRRAVDRALTHKYPVDVASLMDAGEYTVHPDDSIETLQRLMTDSGWGQIPVVSPETGEIIGIVTRTDLLKTLAPQPHLPSRQNMATQLESALPPARLSLIKAVAQEAHEQRAALYIVGGFVRDLLLDRPSQDFDLVVEGDAIALTDALVRRYGGHVTTHARFGTAKWHIEEIRPELAQRLSQLTQASSPAGGERHTRWQAQQTRSAQQRSWGAQPRSNMRLYTQPAQPPEVDLPPFLDLVTARTEFYTYPSALPTVERGSIKLDLHRRDFTINTLALRLDGRHYGELHDYWGGLNDLHNRLVRVLHSLSFVDDPTRMLRAVRFEQRFDFRIEERTLELLKQALSLLERVSGDRVRHELDHILEEPRSTSILARLEQLGLLSAIHPDLTWDNWLESRLELIPTQLPDPDWELKNENGEIRLRRDLGYCLWLLRLPQKRAAQVARRLKLPAYVSQSILEACRLWVELPRLGRLDAGGEMVVQPSQVVDDLESFSPLARYAVYLAAQDLRLGKILLEYATNWRKIKPTVDGHDLRKLGLPPGPIYRKILGALRNAWLDGEVANPQQETAFLNALLEAQGCAPTAQDKE